MIRPRHHLLLASSVSFVIKTEETERHSREIRRRSIRIRHQRNALNIEWKLGCEKSVIFSRDNGAVEVQDASWCEISRTRDPRGLPKTRLRRSPRAVSSVDFRGRARIFRPPHYPYQKSDYSQTNRNL